MTNEAIEAKKGKKSSAKGKKKPTSEVLKEMRGKNGKDPKAAKKEKPKKDNVVVMRGFDMLPPLKEDERQAKAKEIDSEVRSFDREVNARGLKMGIMLREMKGYELWKDLKVKSQDVEYLAKFRKMGEKKATERVGTVFTSFDEWMSVAAPLSRSGGYAQLKTAEKLLPLIPKEELAAYPDYARKLIAKVPKIHLEKVDSPIRKAARTAKSPEELTKEIQKHAPEAHVETTKTIKTNGAAVVDDMIAAGMAIGEVPRNEVLEFIAADWLDSPCTREDYVGMTNRQAWYAITQQTQGVQEQAG